MSEIKIQRRKIVLTSQDAYTQRTSIHNFHRISDKLMHEFNLKKQQNYYGLSHTRGRCIGRPNSKIQTNVNRLKYLKRVTSHIKGLEKC